MKKMIAGCFMVSVFVGTVLFGGVPLHKKHLKKKGLDGAAINCAYCHEKAKNPKTKGNDLVKLKKQKFCAIRDCH
jgi:cytochrome c553